MTTDQILTEIRAMLTEIIGSEYALGLDIGMDTSFDTDLQLESIEFVRLAAMLADRYGNRVDFLTFLAAKDLDEIIEMTVGELVIYIANSLALADVIDG
ncbi:MAG: acyl carrier protein [Pseudonocardiales bacterium]|nr:MAG: acyl carrier protein [Pseudonocardiales bacterium]